MSKREREQATVAVGQLEGVIEILSDVPHHDPQSLEEFDQAVGKALRMVREASERLMREMNLGNTVPVSVAAAELGVSNPTVRAWRDRGLLRSPEGTEEIEVTSLRRVKAALDELRTRGQNRDWLRSLVDLMHDRATLADKQLQRNLQDIASGKFEPA